MSKRYGRNIRWKDGGYQTYVTAGGVDHYETWPASTPLETMRDWVASIKRQGKRAKKGSFAHDARAYLAGVKHLRSYADRVRIVDLWVGEFGHRSLLSIKSHEIAAVLSRWLEEGRARATVRQRRAVLAHIYSTLYPDWPSPLRSVKAPRPAPAEPRGIPIAILERIIAAMPDRGRPVKGRKVTRASETKARLRVELYTGLPHAQLLKLRRSDVDWLGQGLTVPARSKGSGVQGRRLPLTEKALDALRSYDALGLWGKPFSASSVYKSFQAAAKRVRAELAKDGITLPALRVYDIRHSFLTAAYALTGDLRAVGTMAQHSTTALTERYTLAAVDVRLQAVADALTTAWGGDGRAEKLPKNSAAEKAPTVTH